MSNLQHGIVIDVSEVDKDPNPDNNTDSDTIIINKDMNNSNNDLSPNEEIEETE